MAEYLIQDSTLTAIADAIRAKTGTTNSISTSDMANLIESISAGAELNFDVIGGTTEPSNPEENMIWVNTDVPITGYYFSATEPEDMVEGEVWINIGKYSNVGLNLVDNVLVYPLYAKQYIGGTLVDKDAKTYRDGEWVEWILYLYNCGNEFVDFTGGWFTRAWACNEHFSGTSHPTVIKGNNNITITASSPSGMSTNSGVLEVGKDIDVTNASILRATFENITVSGQLTNDYSIGLSLNAVNRNATYYFAGAAAHAVRYSVAAETIDNFVLECDLTGLTGEYDIVIGFSCYCQSTKTNTIVAILKSVEME